MDDNDKRATAALALVSRLIIALTSKGVLTIGEAQRVTDGAALDAEEWGGAEVPPIIDPLTEALNLLRGIAPP